MAKRKGDANHDAAMAAVTYVGACSMCRWYEYRSHFIRIAESGDEWLHETRRQTHMERKHGGQA